MASRLKLHDELCKILGSNNVYYKPPASLRMQYPCIKYSLSGIDTRRANDKNYSMMNCYEVIVIDYDPDSQTHMKLLEHFEMCSFDRNYPSDGLNHNVLTLYY
jgi:hypothetical protein